MLASALTCRLLGKPSGPVRIATYNSAPAHLSFQHSNNPIVIKASYCRLRQHQC